MRQLQKLLQKFLFTSVFILACTPANAQITPDNTLGTEASRLTPNILINNVPGDKIDGGAQRGINLFHSFSQFNVGDGQRVYFGNPVGVENILTRVTGGNASNIFGTLGVDGAANLFLINPNGILFGQNARLDVRGSFLGTTANAVQFGNQGNFSATNPQAPPLLTIQPSALLFNQLNQGAITNRSRPNETDTANSASFSPQQGSRFLVGGDITFDGGGVFAVGNRLELGGLAGVGTVGLTGSGNEMQLNFPENLPRADVTLQNNAFAFTTGGGAVTVYARNLSLSETSFIATALQAGEGKAGIPAGDVVINATGAVTLDSKSFITNTGLDNSLGDSGNVTIDAQSIRLNNTSQITTGGQRSQGNIRLNAAEDVTLDNNSQISTSGSQNSIGNGGDIAIKARTINLSNQAVIDSGNIGQGRSGKTTLQAQDTISLFNGARISSSSGASVFGGTNSEASGDIEIQARTLSLEGEYTIISSRNFDEGRAGDIRITTDDSISLNGFASISSSSNGKGDGGNIQLQTRTLTLSNGANIGTQTQGQGNSGNLLINADSVSLSGSTVFGSRNGESFITGSRLATRAQGSGNGGQLIINTGKLSVRDGGDIATGVGIDQPGRGGDLIINAKDSVEVIGFIPNSGQLSGIGTSTLGSGDAGNLTITTPRLSIRDGGTVTTSAATNTSTGRGGNLTINASDFVEVVGLSPDNKFFSDISAGTLGAGDAGDITINTGRLSIRGGALVGTDTRLGSKGRGGNLTVNASENVEVVGVGITPNGQLSSRLTASTSGAGNAGNLTINARSLSVRDLGIVSATVNSGSTGQGGNLTVNASDFVEVVGSSPDGQLGSVLTTATFGSGNAGRLNINTRRLSIRDLAFISTAAAEGSTGHGGDLTINASDLVELVGHSPDNMLGSFLTTFTEGTGDAGRLSITTNRLSIREGGYITTGTSSTGRGGDININATDSVEIVANPANTDLADGIFTSTGGSGNAGDLSIRTQRLSVRNGGAISAGTAPGSTGRGGNLTVNASDSVEVVGISNNGSLPSFLSVRSRGEGQAGNITVNSPRISVKDKGVINAESFAADGGNITLNTNLLLLRRGGNISATAGLAQGVGNGGNIKINAPLIVAVDKENSDISANAFQGSGGNVTINTKGIFGIVPASFPTAQSDITASSQLGVQGQINIIQPDVQPTQGIIELPDQIIDATNQFAQDCPRGSNAKKPLGKFVVSGRGAIPPSPFQPLVGTSNLSPLATLEGSSPKVSNSSSTPSIPPTQPALVEAQGWVKTPDGKIMLVAQAPETTLSSRVSASVCPVSK
ncbi:filamentous hemagglutinin N-terminal domain-containing protein [Scytonema hofmannii FACHB-248]|uniref:Filamentous hemagglutinin N-terminal domain-containing protein n=1 Tax=Scytonema hofmannii FACHB-248 TaxID=1842502 RepID=A0ABR8GKP2_9CYAN|nr:MULTISPECIES: filamentous hemagglutinin N-terminal domain-containing protein [Nostocales]MBD2603786.1 filamentous hemagglutinin N-terminal domain-containing protein [Scytonema hofmannii FACHB-248]